MFSPTASPVEHYRRVDTATAVSQADPHGLVVLLFDGAIAAIQQARHAIATSDNATKVSSISKAMRIVDEGLQSSLSTRGDAGLVQNLNDLYGHIGARLLEANLRNQDAPLEEAGRLLTDLRDAWISIAPAKPAPLARLLA